MARIAYNTTRNGVRTKVYSRKYDSAILSAATSPASTQLLVRMRPYLNCSSGWGLGPEPSYGPGHTDLRIFKFGFDLVRVATFAQQATTHQGENPQSKLRGVYQCDRKRQLVHREGVRTKVCSRHRLRVGGEVPRGEKTTQSRISSSILKYTKRNTGLLDEQLRYGPSPDEQLSQGWTCRC